MDRIPNLNILMTFAAKFSNINYSEFCKKPECMFVANMKCYEEFGIDAVTTMSDPYAEASDFGAQIEYPFDSNPICRTPLLKEIADLKKMRIYDIGDTTRMYNRIRVIELYNRNVKGICPIIGWVEGAFAEFIDLRGMEMAMMDFSENRNFMTDVMDICLEQSIIFAKEQIRAGADIIGVGDAAVSLIGGRLYSEVVLPYEKKLIESIHNGGAKVKLHICGNIMSLLDVIAETGADIIDIDWPVDFSIASKKLNGLASVNGNFDPVSILLQGNTESVKNAVMDCVIKSNESAIISAGCEVPVNTPFENLLAVYKTLKDLGYEN